ncbi:MAG: DUF503 domain-containing protein [Deltaproteobacteria bacterium]|nr:DUF503 domain-containing protein [Deltaproteobacteria bacterium]MBN2671394.1 DUF503 domain-containing protein [Deltaproteobacteria bacterium]
MFVAVGRLSFHLAGNTSLKGKRSIVRKMVDRAKSKFNVSVAEVGSNDEHRKAVIGVAVIGNSASHVDGMLAKICDFIIGMGMAELISHQTEVIPMGTDFGEDRYFSAMDFSVDDFGVEDNDG